MLGLPQVAQQRRRLLRWFASSVATGNTNSQAVALVLDGVTIAATQVAQHPQSVTATLADITAAANQTAQHPQVVSFTLDGVTVAATQTAQHPQTAAITLADVVAAASQTATHPQALAVTLDGITVSGQQGGAVVPPPVQIIFGVRMRSHRKRDAEEEQKPEHVTDAVFEEIKIKPRNKLRLRQIRIEDTTSHLVTKGVARARQIKQRRDEEDLLLMF